MIKKFDKLWLGLSLGLVFPILSILIFYFSAHNTFLKADFYKTIIETDLHIKILSLCVLPNLLLFFIFIWTYRNYSARGVLMSTFMYAILIFAVKLFL